MHDVCSFSHCQRSVEQTVFHCSAQVSVSILDPLVWNSALPQVGREFCAIVAFLLLRRDKISRKSWCHPPHILKGTKCVAFIREPSQPMAQQRSIVFLFRLKLGIEIPCVKAKPSCLGLFILRSEGSSSRRMRVHLKPLDCLRARFLTT